MFTQEEFKENFEKKTKTIMEKLKDATGVGSNAQLVLPHKNGWAVRPRGAERPTSVHDTKDEATTRARELAKRQQSQLVIFDQDSNVQQKYTYA